MKYNKHNPFSKHYSPRIDIIIVVVCVVVLIMMGTSYGL